MQIMRQERFVIYQRALIRALMVSDPERHITVLFADIIFPSLTDTKSYTSTKKNHWVTPSQNTSTGSGGRVMK